MLRLSVMSGPQDGLEALVAGDSARLGPDPSCDLVLPHDPSIDPAGAVARQIEGALWVEYAGEHHSVGQRGMLRLGQTWVRFSHED
jgi:hypothetical protein